MKYIQIITITAAAAAFSGCATAQTSSASSTPPSTTTRALQGGAAGAIAGAVIGNNTGSGNGGKGAMIGAGAGVVLGSLYSLHEKSQVSEPAAPTQRIRVFEPEADSASRQQAREMALREVDDAQRQLEGALYYKREADARVTLAEAKLAAAKDTLNRLR